MEKAIQEGKLRQKTQVILKLKQDIGKNAWELGFHLNEIKEKGFYLEKYGTWSEFLEKGIDISDRSAQRFMRISSEFEPPAVADWGVHKLDLLLSLEEPIRKEVLKIHQAADSVRELKRTAIRLKSEPVASQPIEIDFFVKTEELLRDLLQQISKVKDHLCSCRRKELFKTYPRGEVILKLWRDVENECKND